MNDNVLVISVLIPHIFNNVEPGGKYFKSESSLIYSAVKNEIIFSNKFVRHTFIREGIEFIGESAFARSQIRRITFPCSLKEIGPGAFDSCTKLKTIRFKEQSSLISIGDYAFFHNVKIERVKFPSSLMRIGKHAFQWNSQLKVVQFPLSIVEIDDFAFLWCHSFFKTNELGIVFSLNEIPVADIISIRTYLEHDVRVLIYISLHLFKRFRISIYYINQFCRVFGLVD